MAKYVTEDNLIRYTAALKLNATVLDRNKPYVVGDIVQKGQVYLKCITAGTTATTALTLSSVINTVLTDGTVEWQVIDPFAETKIRNWESGVKYEVSRIVKYNGSLYRCITANMDTTFTIANWELLATGITDWASNVDYTVGQFVVYNGVLYKCTTSNNDSTFNPSNWQKIAGGGIDSWASNTIYSVGDVVIYSNNIYQCNTAHTSGSTFNPDASKWTEISACITRIPNWVANKNYVVGDLVANDAKIYRCTVAHTSGATFDSVEEANWEELSPTINEISMWAVSTNYAVGQLVIHNNKLYRCNTAHTSDSSSFNTDIAYWDEIGSSGGIEPWKANELYAQGNMVVYNDKIYICDTAHTSTSTFDPTKWHEISSNNIDSWQTSTSYSVGDMVVRDGQLYRCITAHTSDSSNFNNDIANWQTLDTKFLAKDWASNKLYLTDEVVSFDDVLYKANTNHTSSSTIDLDDSKLDFIYANIRPWKSNTYYRQGSIVTYNRNIYRCIASHTSGNSLDNKVVLNLAGGVGYDIDIQASDPRPKSMVHDLGSICKLNSVSMRIGGDNPYDSDVSISYSLEGSLDGVNYITLRSVTERHSGQAWGDPVSFTVNANVRYLKRTILDSVHYGTNVPAFASWKETIVYADPGMWEKLSVSQELKEWKAGDSYYVGDTVIYQDSSGSWIIYKCITANNDGVFTPSKWVEVSPCVGIEEWTSGSDYASGDIIIYNNNLYKVVNDVTGATDAPDNSNDYVLLGGASIKTWVGSKEYSAGTIVLYQNRLYRNSNDIPSSVTTFSRDDWTPLSPVLEDWTSSKEYKVGDFVIRNDILYECITDNNDATFNYAKWKPISKDGINAWQSNKQYALYDLVVEDEELYMCISPHTSSSDFQTDLDAERWKLIGGGGGSGGDWNQVTKINVVAPLDVDINIPYTNTFKRPPVEVLKYEQGTTDITTNVLNFGVGDGSKFEVDGVIAKDSPLITFGGVAKPNHDVLYPFGTPTQMVNKYYSESEEIDLDDFKVVGEVSLE